MYLEELNRVYGANSRPAGMGSFLAVQTQFSRTAAFERLADADQAEFRTPWSERQLSPKAVIRLGLDERT